MSALFKWRGPTLKKIFNKLEKKNLDMIKIPMRNSAKLVRSQAREDAPVVSGAYRKSIGLSVRTNKRAGLVVAKVGIPFGHEVLKYARKVENKHHIYSRLEKTQEKPVRNEFGRGLQSFFNKLRIR